MLDAQECLFDARSGRSSIHEHRLHHSQMVTTTIPLDARSPAQRVSGITAGNQRCSTDPQLLDFDCSADNLQLGVQDTVPEWAVHDSHPAHAQISGCCPKNMIPSKVLP